MTSTISDPNRALRQRRYRSLPPAQYLTPGIIAAAAEADRIAAELRAAIRRLADISTGEAADAAAKLDREATVAAIRAGKPASIVGTPAADALAAEQDALGPQIDALSAALGDAEGEIAEQFVALQTKPKLNGQAALTAADAKYRTAVRAMLDARREWANAAALEKYFRRAHADGNWNETTANPPITLPVAPGQGAQASALIANFDTAIIAITAEVDQ